MTAIKMTIITISIHSEGNVAHKKQDIQRLLRACRHVFLASTTVSSRSCFHQQAAPELA